MKKKTIILAGFILLKFLLQYLLVNTHCELHRDEYLHLDQANHLARGYQSVPPVTSWISYIIKRIENFIRVKEFNGSEDELAETAPFFTTAFVEDSITSPLAREYKTKIFVFTKPTVDINQRLEAELENKKNFTTSRIIQ